MKILVVYPHGLGDCILATPALRALKGEGHHVGFAMLSRFESSRLFECNTNVDELFWTKDAWNDFASFEEGCIELKKYCWGLAANAGYDRVIFVNHSPMGSKILDTAKAVGVELDDTHTKVYISSDDMTYVNDLMPESHYGFVHTHTGVPSKDLPEGWGRDYMQKAWGIDTVIEVGVDFQYDEIPIGAQFELMRNADRIVVPDSVFFHAACAMDKPVDLAYFAKGKGVYDRVKPLHEVEHNVVWELP